MSLTAPYSNAMRIGQGFNTYTQEIRLENAVRVGTNKGPKKPSEITESSKPASPPVTPERAPSPSPGAAGGVPAIAVNGVAPSPPATPEPGLGGAIDVVSAPVGESPFELPPGPIPTTSQSVTYSTRAIENVSDIMDALNISTSMSIKYGTIHGNGNASFVNENKVLDSELNYVVSVIVNNDAHAAIEEMEFQEIPGLPLDRFTEVYGDSFISGFTEGGEFNAVISIKLMDKSKHKSVKQAVDVQLAVGPPTLEVGASEAIEKEHNEALKNTEISISVNWVGGGEIKKPKVPWTIKSVVGVANAFPSMVARSSARTQAILTRYTSLRSFQAWKWSRILEEQRIWESDPRNQKGGENNKDGTQRYEEPVIILNYVPCSLYTADLFDALMTYKKLWKRISEMLQNPSRYKLRPQPKKEMAKQNGKPTAKPTNKNLSPVLTKDIARQTFSDSPSTADGGSPCQDMAGELTGMERAFTFAVGDGKPGWNLAENNMRTDPIAPEPVALNEAKLLCRESMTLITEEASRLVDHPHLAYAEYDSKTKSTRMKRPNYAYPEVLKERLPIPIHNDIVSDLSTDGAYLKTVAYARDDNIWFEPDMVGDAKASPADMSTKFGPLSKYEDFSTLELTERTNNSAHQSGGSTSSSLENPLTHISLHRSKSPFISSLLSSSTTKPLENAIGCLGLAFAHPTALPPSALSSSSSSTISSHDPSSPKPDNCTTHLGHYHHHHSSTTPGTDFRALSLRGVDITKIDVAYLPGSGYIAGLTFFDEVDGQVRERLRWRQWEAEEGEGGMREPAGMKHVLQEPPERGDGTVWRFVGLAGSWVNLMGKGGHVLARVSGVWKRVGE